MASLVIRFSGDSAARFEAMHKVSGISDASETVAHALQIYEYLLERSDEGCTFTMSKPGCGPEPLEIFAKEAK